MVVALVGAAAMVAVGCGPKKEEMVPWDPAMATAVATPAEGAPAVTETPPPALPPVEAGPAPAPKIETAPPVHKAKAKTSAGETVSKSKRGSHTYTVKAGDTLSGIAKRVYGDANQWKKIADANKDKIHNKNRITVGMVLAIPPK
jgi:nucleoid-associated protein YgaU